MTDMQTITGIVWAVFGHRFALSGQDGRYLAALGPKGSETIKIAQGDTVTIKGERKPSEIKVSAITLANGTTCDVAWPKKPHEDDGRHGPADPASALAAVEAQGYAIEGRPERKPKHFEIVGVKDGVRHAIHVELDGKVRHTKPIAA
jgi:hypothetical protein